MWVRVPPLLPGKTWVRATDLQRPHPLKTHLKTSAESIRAIEDDNRDGTKTHSIIILRIIPLTLQ